MKGRQSNWYNYQLFFTYAFVSYLTHIYCYEENKDENRRQVSFFFSKENTWETRDNDVLKMFFYFYLLFLFVNTYIYMTNYNNYKGIVVLMRYNIKNNKRWKFKKPVGLDIIFSVVFFLTFVVSNLNNV